MPEDLRDIGVGLRIQRQAAGRYALPRRVLHRGGSHVPVVGGLGLRRALGATDATKPAVRTGLGPAILSRDTMALEGETGRRGAPDLRGLPLVRTWIVAGPCGKHLSVAAAEDRLTFGGSKDHMPSVSRTILCDR